MGYIPWGHKELDTTEHLPHTHTHTHTHLSPLISYLLIIQVLWENVHSLYKLFYNIKKTYLFHRMSKKKKNQRLKKKNHTRLALRSVVFHSEVGIPFL